MLSPPISSLFCLQLLVSLLSPVSKVLVARGVPILFQPTCVGAGLRLGQGCWQQWEQFHPPYACFWVWGIPQGSRQGVGTGEEMELPSYMDSAESGVTNSGKQGRGWGGYLPLSTEGKEGENSYLLWDFKKSPTSASATQSAYPGVGRGGGKEARSRRCIHPCSWLLLPHTHFVKSWICLWLLVYIESIPSFWDSAGHLEGRDIFPLEYITWFLRWGVSLLTLATA